MKHRITWDKNQWAVEEETSPDQWEKIKFYVRLADACEGVLDLRLRVKAIERLSPEALNMSLLVSTIREAAVDVRVAAIDAVNSKAAVR